MKTTNDAIYIFLHIPKSAGTTFRHHIEHNFAPEEIVALYRADDARLRREDVFARLQSLPDEQRRRLRVIYGHEVYHGIHELFDRPCRYVTFLRDPIDKTISFYNYRMQQGIRKGTIDPAALPRFEDWLEASRGMHDGMLGDLVKYGFADGPDVSEPALRAVLQKFYFVGTTENFDEDAMFLYHELGIRRFFRDQNRSERFLTPAEVERVAPLIAEKTPLDRKLYDFAVAWNRDFRQRHAGFAAAVAKTKLKRALAMKVQRLLPG
ncbi:MAG: sulfotransferase family 2 domain-containing protein [Burkholderiales bacterium]|nr:sulfotransferase family 2 domain-containing protein [Burkholderiales bacterium]